MSNKGQTNYWGYLIKRFVRIYIPYYFWIIITLALFMLFSPYEVVGLRDWFYDRWQGSIIKLDILNHFVLINNFFTENYNPVIWSLAQEMRISIAFPLFFLLTLCITMTLLFSIVLYHLIKKKCINWSKQRTTNLYIT